MSTPTEFIYDTPLWKVRRLGEGWYQGESVLFNAPLPRTRDHSRARVEIEVQVRRLLSDEGYEYNP